MIFIILVLGFPLRYCSIGTECLGGVFYYVTRINAVNILFRININNMILIKSFKINFVVTN